MKPTSILFALASFAFTYVYAAQQPQTQQLSIPYTQLNASVLATWNALLPAIQAVQSSPLNSLTASTQHALCQTQLVYTMYEANAVLKNIGLSEAFLGEFRSVRFVAGNDSSNTLFLTNLASVEGVFRAYLGSAEAAANKSVVSGGDMAGGLVSSVVMSLVGVAAMF